MNQFSVLNKYNKELYNEIIVLFERAKIRDKYVIHYGI